MRNLNIKSDETYELAQFLAKRTGRTIRAVVHDALVKEKKALTKEELRAKWNRIAKENRKNADPEWLNWNYDSELYDEKGLPR